MRAKSYMTNGLIKFGGEIWAYPHIWLCIRSHLSFLIYEENLVFFFISVLFYIGAVPKRYQKELCIYIVWTERLFPHLEDMSSNPLCGQEPGALITYRWDPRGTVCSKIDQMTQFFFAASFKTHRFLDCLLWVIFSLRKWSSPRFTIGDNHCNRCRYSWGMAVLKIGMQ